MSIASRGKDTRCHKCGHCYDWKATFTERPPCPQCGAPGAKFQAKYTAVPQEVRKQRQARWAGAARRGF